MSDLAVQTIWFGVVMGCFVLIPTFGCARGRAWGPVLLGLGFASWGALYVLDGYEFQARAIGLLFLGGGIAEFIAASAFLRWGGDAGGPPHEWRRWAATVGVAGYVLFMVQFMLNLQGGLSTIG